MLLSRDEFRTAVLTRDKFLCVICKAKGQDAHHIMERRLFPDGGYYLDNGATVCGTCHILAEQTVLSCDEIRHAAGISTVILPPHLYKDQPYDKWGNPILPSGTRIQGELFHDISVQKILEQGKVLSLFTHYVKYPRTFHLPFSPGVTKDDRVMQVSALKNKNTPPYEFFETRGVVVTEKMDGENTTLYSDYIHARSIDYSSHISRDRAKSIWASIAHDIPVGYRICAENVYARHSIHYKNLSGFLLMFSMWERDTCLSWDVTCEWAELLGLPMVPVLYQGAWNEAKIKKLARDVVNRGGEGIVVRIPGPFSYTNFPRCVGKYVRQDHVQTHGHWMRQLVVTNELA